MVAKRAVIGALAAAADTFHLAVERLFRRRGRRRVFWLIDIRRQVFCARLAVTDRRLTNRIPTWVR